MSVFLQAHAQYRGVYIGIARKLRAELGAEIHLFVGTPQDRKVYERAYPGLFASIEIANALYDSCRKPVPDADAVIAEARRNEADLGVGISELSVSDRHLGRGFSLGGFRHPRSRISEETGQIQLLNGYNSVIAFWRREIADKQPELILNAGKVLSVLARANDIPTRTLAGSRFRNYYYWAVNEFFENPDFEKAFPAAQPTPDTALQAPYDSHMRFRKHFQREASLWRTAKLIARHIASHLYWHLRKYDKAKGYYLSENIKYLWRRHRAVKAMTAGDVPALDGFSHRPFAFFPLATEPETALQMLSPEYLYQLPAIASVARDLPAGAELAVKEHYAAAGRRPADFYAQILDFKNVRLMNMAELGMEAARASRVVVTITGSSGFEAAAMGKPVITFGRHNIYNFLPHVMVVTDEADIGDYLARAFSDDFDSKSAERDGRQFLQAVADASFDLHDFQPIEPERISDEAVAAAYRSLLDGLEKGSSEIAVAS